MKETDFDRFADRYDDLLREGTDFFSDDATYFARYKVEIVRRILPEPPARVLEFGCGIGRNIPHLRAAFPGAEVVGSDVSARSLETARAENPGVRFWRDGDAEGERSAFDLVFVACVFHHIRPGARAAAARLLAERLRPGGTAVIFEHNPYNPITRRIVSRCPFDEGVALLPPAEVRGLLARAGLTRRRWGYSLFFPPRLGALVRLEPLLAPLPFGGQYWVAAVRE